MKLTNKTMKSPINNHSIWPHGLVRTINFILFALVLFTGTSLMAKGREADLPSPQCDSLNVPAGNRVSAHLYALGVQIYRWNGTAWAFVGPDATLYADQGFNGQAGTHYVGPTWEAEDGSKVVAAKFSDCLPNRGAVRRGPQRRAGRVRQGHGRRHRGARRVHPGVGDQRLR